MTLYAKRSLRIEGGGAEVLRLQCRPLGAIHGFDLGMYFHCIPSWEGDGGQVLVSGTEKMWPFIDYYLREQLECPFLIYSLQAPAPFRLADAPFPEPTPRIDGAIAEMVKVAGPDWLKLGWGLPVFGPQGTRGFYLIILPAGSAPSRELYCDLHVVHRAFTLFRLSGQSAPPMLEPELQQVLVLTARGCDHKEIAREMGVTVEKARWRQRMARERLDCGNMAAAVVKATKLGLIL